MKQHSVRSRDANGKLKDPTGMHGAFTANGYVYTTLERASIGRLYAEALKNVPRLNKRSSSGWVDLARATGIINHERHLNKGNFTKGVSSKIFGMANRGTLPKDPEQLRKLLELAGSPWLEMYGGENALSESTNRIRFYEKISPPTS